MEDAMTTPTPHNEPNEEHEMVDPLFNDAFLSIFGRDDSKNVTIGLINAIFRAVGIEPIGDIEFIVPDCSQIDWSIRCKTARYDIRITTGGSVLDLEAQCYPGQFEKRVLFYASKIIASSLRKGDDYQKVPQVYVITLLDTRSKFPETDDFIAVGSTAWHEGSVCYPAKTHPVYIVVELEKFRKRYTELNEDVLSSELLSWLYTLTRGYRERSEVGSMAERFPTIEEFSVLYGIALNDPDIVQAYENYEYNVREEKRREDWYRQLEEEGRARGLTEGRAKGLAEGRAEVREEILAKLRASGVDESIIASL